MRDVRKSAAMCKHVLNAQVAVRAPCCKRWFDCPECHAEQTDHELLKTTEMVFACKKCKKCFRKDMKYVSPLLGGPLAAVVAFFICATARPGH